MNILEFLRNTCIIQNCFTCIFLLVWGHTLHMSLRFSIHIRLSDKRFLNWMWDIVLSERKISTLIIIYCRSNLTWSCMFGCARYICSIYSTQWKMGKSKIYFKCIPHLYKGTYQIWFYWKHDNCDKTEGTMDKVLPIYHAVWVRVLVAIFIVC